MSRLAALCFASLSLLLTVSARAETFRNPPQFHTGTATLTLITADINGDQIPDMVYLDANGMHVLLGKGDGTFTHSADIATPPGVYGFVTAADVNKDGRLDLLMPGTILAGFNQTTAYLGVALQNANGTFQPMSVTTIPDSNPPAYNNSPGAVTNISVADFNGDGNPDVVFGNGVTTAIYVLFGDGTGKFNLNSTTGPLDDSPGQAFALDLNGDGHPDILIHTAYNAIVFLNKGDGTFAGGTPIIEVEGSSFIGETAVLLHDMDGDGISDILTVDFNGELKYFPGRRDGTFGPEVNLAQLVDLLDPVPAAVGDFNHDGIPDIALTTHDGIAILFGQGANKFAAPEFFNGASYPYLPAVADFNGDGNLDFAENAGDGIVFLFGNKDGTLQSLASFPQGDNIGSAAVGDFNNDGIQDVAFTNANGGLLVAFGRGDGTLPTNVASSAGDNAGAGLLIPGRFNGTNSLDIFETSPFERGSVLINQGDGTFSDQTPSGFFNLPVLNAAAADLNGDGLTDLVGSNALNGQISFLTNTGKQSFTTFNLTTPDTYGGPFAVGHFHKNKIADVVSCNAYGFDAYTFNGVGDGTMSQGATFATLGLCRDLAVGDFDGDGNQDFILLFKDLNNAQSYDLPVAEIFYGNGDGTFQPPVQQSLARGYLRVTAGDLNGDGIDDMVFTDQLGVAVLHGNRSRTLGPEDHYVAGTSPYKPQIADMNGDGIPDLVFADVDPMVFVPRFDFTGFHDTVANATTIVVLLGQDPHYVQGTLTFSPDPSIFGQSFTMTARFVPSIPGSGNPTGTVDFSIDGGAAVTVPLTGSSATTAGPATLSTGTHTITASYSGDSFFKHSTISAQHIVKGLPTIVLRAAPNPANFGQDVVFTATVSAGNIANVPTGSVSFLDAGAVIGSGTLDASGVASYDTATLAAGTHPITAVFAATSNFAQSTSNGVTEQIVAPGPPPGPADFSIVATPSKQTGERGITATYVITISPLNGFNLPVSLDCPAILPTETVCSMTPGSVVSGGNGTSTLVLQTTTARPVTNAKSQDSSLPWKAAVITFACVILIRPRGRKTLLLILLTAIMLTGGGCGSPGDLGTAPGSYAMVVKATAVGNNALSHSAAITLVVQ